MRRIVCSELGPVEGLTIEEAEDPTPGPGSVLVDVRAAGVNYVDALFVQGRYQIKPPVPFVPGSEVAGVVEAVGDGVEVEVGTRVMASIGLGGYASKVVVPAASVVPLPDGLSEASASALVQSYCTALFALTRRTTVTAGESILVLGAGGGVGLATIDVGRALGLRPIAAASSAEKRDAALAIGAEAAFDYTTDDLKTKVRELAGGTGADLVLDPVGAEHADAALRSLGNFGRYLVIGFAGGPIPSLPLNQILLRNRTVIGVDWGAWGMQNPDAQRALLAEVLSMVGEGRLHPPEPTTYPLASASTALSDLLNRKVVGKAVLLP